MPAHRDAGYAEDFERAHDAVEVARLQPGGGRRVDPS
jgi:hypothetical protein